ncbi:MAG: hypothetical protein ACK5LT_02230 [Lachnospirales bacterium]
MRLKKVFVIVLISTFIGIFVVHNNSADRLKYSKNTMNFIFVEVLSDIQKRKF